MPEVREVFDMATQKVRPDPDSLEEQHRDQRRHAARQKATVFVLVGALVIGAAAFGISTLRADRGSGVPLGPNPTTSPQATSVSGRSHHFDAPFTYTVPADWTFSGEGARSFSWETPSAGSTDVILLSNVVAAAPDCSASPAPEQGVGTSSGAMINWLSTNPALDATTPHPVRLGAATGSYVDIQLAENVSCSNGLPLVTAQPDDIQWWSIYGNWKERVYVLDLPSGDTVTIVLDEAASPSNFQSLIDEAAPVVDSFHFLNSR
jgi:hypothetical protein